MTEYQMIRDVKVNEVDSVIEVEQSRVSEVERYAHPLHRDHKRGSRANELMAFHGVEMSEGDGPSIVSMILSLNEMNATTLVLIGAMSVVMVLMAFFYVVRRSEKEQYEPLE